MKIKQFLARSILVLDSAPILTPCGWELETWFFCAHLHTLAIYFYNMLLFDPLPTILCKASQNIQARGFAKLLGKWICETPRKSLCKATYAKLPSEELCKVSKQGASQSTSVRALWSIHTRGLCKAPQKGLHKALGISWSTQARGFAKTMLSSFMNPLSKGLCKASGASPSPI